MVAKYLTRAELYGIIRRTQMRMIRIRIYIREKINGAIAPFINSIPFPRMVHNQKFVQRNPQDHYAQSA